MMRHGGSPEGEHWQPMLCNFRIIAQLHRQSRYHFSVVDTYCGLTQNKNYISLLFQGGAADYVRRTRRAQAMAEILKEHGFSVQLKHDLINARLSKGTREETVTQLEMLGSILQFFRQMDVAMVNENAVTLFRDAFLRGD
jgi:pyruvate,water dikinase